jgi:hypothetical protein
MKKVETTLENLKSDIGQFYQPDKQHFIVMNAVDLNDVLEVQWFFSDYDPPYEVTTFYTQIHPEEEIPFYKRYYLFGLGSRSRIGGPYGFTH